MHRFHNSQEELIAASASHPLVLQMYCLATPALEASYKILLRRIQAGVACCGFVAMPRAGKTTTFNYSYKNLRTSGEPIYVIKLIAEGGVGPRANDFFRWMLAEIGSPPFKRDSSFKYIDILVNRLQTEALAAKAHRIVLLIDEVTQFTIAQFGYLLDLGNKLKARDLPLTTITFGPPHISYTVNSMLMQGRTDLLNRFLSRLHKFNGIRTVAELKKILETFDDCDAAYPPESGCSFTEFFLPAMYAKGWRLQDQAGTLFKHFKDCAKNKSKTEFEIGAEYLFIAVEFSLKFNMSVDRLELKKDTWKISVSESGFIDALGVSFSHEHNNK